MRPSYDPLSTRGARLHGGRWNSPGTPALYTSTDPGTVRAELVRQGELQGLREAELYPLAVAELEARPKLVRLTTEDALRGVGVEPPVSVLTDRNLTRRVGDAAAKLGIEALLVPSVAVPAENVVLLTAAFDAGVHIVARHRVRSAGGWPPGS